MLLTVEISEEDFLLLKNDLLDPQIWFEQAIKGKINNCWKRMYSQWVPKFLADPAVSQIPATRSGFIQAVITHPKYKNRSDAEKIGSTA